MSIICDIDLDVMFLIPSGRIPYQRYRSQQKIRGGNKS